MAIATVADPGDTAVERLRTMYRNGDDIADDLWAVYYDVIRRIDAEVEQFCKEDPDDGFTATVDLIALQGCADGTSRAYRKYFETFMHLKHNMEYSDDALEIVAYQCMTLAYRMLALQPFASDPAIRVTVVGAWLGILSQPPYRTC